MISAYIPNSFVDVCYPLILNLQFLAMIRNKIGKEEIVSTLKKVGFDIDEG